MAWTSNGVSNGANCTDRSSRSSNQQGGFTLLETLIAMAIMLVAFTAILSVQSSSINTTIKAKEMNIVTMLAKSAMIEAEFAIQGKTFNEVEKETKGNFPEPYKDYEWSRVIKEVKFPNLAADPGGEEGGGGTPQAQPQIAGTITKLITKYLSKAIREVTITVQWQRGKGKQKFTVATYWINLDTEFELNE